MNESMNKFLPPEFAAKLRKETELQQHLKSVQLLIDGIDLVSTIAKHKSNDADCVMVIAAAVAYIKLSYTSAGKLTEEEFDARFGSSVGASLNVMKNYA